MLQITDIVDRVQNYHPGADIDLIRRCYDFAAKAHDGQLRRSGDPYVVHPLGVAGLISELRLDVPSVCAGLLHDCVEDTSASTTELERLFGQEIAFLVEGVTKLGKIPWQNREERQAENFRKMLLAMARDIRVILIKLADRTDNMRTLASMSPEKQERIARETMEIYAPLANRLGIQWIKVELEDLCFKYLYPKDHEELSNKLESYHRERKKYIVEVTEVLKHELADAGVAAEVYGRPKHLWSIFQKIRKTERELEQLFDIVAFRVIVKDVRACYETLGLVHSKWTPIPGRFKDFIALPKPNMYQSLHTSVIGPRNERMEVQIRTEEMHRVAEQGIAAHWAYKEGKSLGPQGPAQSKDDKRFAWLRQLMEWQKDLTDPTEFIETVKIDLFADEVYVFTPKGDVKALPKGANPIDLAYAIHTEVGNHCSGARVNGLIVPLRYSLRNGDTVEILTSPNQKPNKDWLKFCVTSSAKAKIRTYLRTEQRERSRALGRELLERELKKYGYGWSKLEKSGDLDRAAEQLKNSSAVDLLTSIGYGRVLPGDVVEKIIPEDKRRALADNPPSENPVVNLLRSVVAPRRVMKSSAGIKVAGEDDVLVRFAKCCAPVPGDPIVGFISVGRGVTIHQLGCRKALDLDPERRIEVEWDGEQKALRPVSIQVVSADKPGILASLSQSFNDLGVNISQANCRAMDDNKALNTFQFGVRDLEQLKTVMRALQRVSGVYSVTRM
jgi:GTP pyrophosphokinase